MFKVTGVLIKWNPNSNIFSIELYLSDAWRWVAGNCRTQRRQFTAEQCSELIQSSLGEQCETLTIRVKDRRIVLQLVNGMKHLQAMKVQCDDTHRTDNLLAWLRKYLPAKESISDGENFAHGIHIWIR